MKQQRLTKTPMYEARLTTKLYSVEVIPGPAKKASPCTSETFANKNIVESSSW